MSKYFVICLVLIICLTVTGCISDKKYDELEKRVSNLEKMVGVSNETIYSSTGADEEAIEDHKSEYLSARGIELLYEFDPETNSWTGQYYQLRLSEDKCTLTYHEKDNYKDDIYCDFSKETYDEFLNMICDQDLEEFESKVDSTGKIIYEQQQYILGLYLNGSHGTTYFKNPQNMDDIIKKFESLRDSAKQ